MNDREVLDKLLVLSRIEADAINSYDSALSEIEDKVIKKQMENFCRDHIDHLKVISMLMREFGGTQPEEISEFKGFWNRDFLTVEKGEGSKKTLEILLSNERIINEVYERTFNYKFDKDSRAQLEGNFDDEQDHVAYIEDILSLRAKAA